MSTVESLPSELFDRSSSMVHDRDDALSQHTNTEADRISRQIEVYKIKTARERERLEGLREQIISIECKALEQKSLGSTSDEHKVEVERKLHIDRLNKKLVTLNTKLSHNQELRKKIDEMRQDRCRYDAVYTSLEEQVAKQAEKMAEVLESAKKTIKLRDKALGELEASSKQLEESKRALELEQEELSKLEEQFRHEEEAKKIERRISRPLTVASQRTAADEKDEVDEFDNEKELDEALSKVFELTGMNDVDQLIDRLVQTEEAHFSLFGRINELEAEIDENKTKISDAEQELKMAQRCGINDGTQRQKEIASVGEKRKQLEEKMRDVELRSEAQLSTWNSMRSKILSVHDELGLSLPEDLVGTSSVTENNVFQYLAAIEHKACEIIVEMKGSGEEDEEEDGEGAPGGAPILPAGQVSFARGHELDLPSAATAGECSSTEDDDGERPFTMKELQESLRAEGVQA